MKWVNGFILFGSLCASWTCTCISFTTLGKFSFIIFSNKFPISSFSSPSSTPMMQVLDYLMLFQRLLTLFLFIGFFFSYCSDCFLLPYVPNHWFEYWLYPLYFCFPINYSFRLLCSLFLTGSFLCWWGPPLSSLSILLTSALNSASDRLLTSISFSSFFWSFGLFFHLGHVCLSPHFCSLPVFVSMY